MSIRSTSGDLLTAKVDAVVNPVNCVGVMGAGLARAVKERWPHVYAAYRRACEQGRLRPGTLHAAPTNEPQPRIVINFPTKRHWRQRSRLDDIEAGIKALRQVLEGCPDLQTVALPRLGSGLGGRDWEQEVRPLVVRYLGDLRIEIVLYE